MLELYRLLNLERVEWQPGPLADLRAVQIGLPTGDQLRALRAVSCHQPQFPSSLGYENGHIERLRIIAGTKYNDVHVGV